MYQLSSTPLRSNLKLVAIGTIWIVFLFSLVWDYVSEKYRSTESFFFSPMSTPLAFLYSPFIVVKLKYSHSSFQLIDRPSIIILTKFVLATIKGEESKLRERLTACMGASTRTNTQSTRSIYNFDQTQLCQRNL